MKRFPFLFCLLCMFITGTPKASAQYYFYDNNYYDNPVIFELGGSVALMNCLTDIGGRKGIGKKFVKDLNIGNTQMAGSIYAAALYKNKIGVRLEGTFGQIRSYDSILKKVRATVFGRYERNLSFRSKISEFSITTELHPLFLFINWEGRDGEPPRYSPYIIAGIGFFSFNPQGRLGNTWIDLQPLSTEGEGFSEYPDRKVYKLQQISYPIGLGMKYDLSSMFNIRAEMVLRFTSTDYLDDASTYFIDPAVFPNHFSGTKLTNAFLLSDRGYELDPSHTTIINKERGNPKNNDAFFTFNLKIGLILGRERIKR
ncbi:MAG: hypothetical protein ABJA78_01145 [Ferruginibacter sp.]